MTSLDRIYINLMGRGVYSPVPNTMGPVQKRTITAKWNPMLVWPKRNLDLDDARNKSAKRHNFKTVTTCTSNVIAGFNLFCKVTTSQTNLLSRVHTKIVLL